MVRLHEKNFLKVLGIVLMLAASPLGVTHAETEEINQSTEQKKSPKNTKSESTSELKIIIEKVIDGELRVMYLDYLPEMSIGEIQQRVMMEGATNWAYVSNNNHHSGIVIYEGNSRSVEDFDYSVIFSGEGISEDSSAYILEQVKEIMKNQDMIKQKSIQSEFFGAEINNDFMIKDGLKNLSILG